MRVKQTSWPAYPTLNPLYVSISYEIHFLFITDIKILQQV